MNKYTETQIAQAIEMKQDGKTFKQISKVTKMKPGSINYYLKRANSNENTELTAFNISDTDGYTADEPQRSRFEYIVSLPISGDEKITLLRWLQA